MTHPASDRYTFRYSWSRRLSRRAYRAIRAHWRPSLWVRLLYWGYGAGVVFVAGLVLFTYLQGDRAQAGSLVLPLVVLAGYPLLVRYGMPWYYAWHQSRYYGEEGAELWLSVDEAGVRHGFPSGEHFYDWSGIRRVVESPELVIFYMTRNAAIWVPVEAVGPDLPRFRERVDRMASGAGGVRTPRTGGRVRRVAWAGLAVAYLGFCVAAGLAPPEQVIAGSELRPSYRDLLRSEGLIDAGEEVLYFSTEGLWSIREGIDLVTSRGVVSWADLGAETYHEVAGYDEIDDIRWTREPDRTVVEVETIDGRTIILYASPTNGGDIELIERLEVEWQTARGGSTGSTP